MRAKITYIVTAAVLVFYFVLVGSRGGPSPSPVAVTPSPSQEPGPSPRPSPSPVSRTADLNKLAADLTSIAAAGGVKASVSLGELGGQLGGLGHEVIIVGARGQGLGVPIYSPDRMRAVDVIMKKRDGSALSREEIRFFVDGVTAGTLPDYQASALLMAVLLRGMSAEEVAKLQAASAKSAAVETGSFGIDRGGFDAKAALFWAFVGIPLAWGVWKTLESAVKIL